MSAATTHPFAEAVAIAADLYTDAELAVWLTAPQPQADNWTPLQLLGCGKSAELLAAMRRLVDGVYL